MSEQIDKLVEDEVLVEEDLTSLDESTDWKAKAEELEQKRREDGIKQRERSKALKQQLADAKKAVEDATKPKDATLPKTGELDETALDYLDLKGITENEDVKVVQDIVKKTGLTVRQALKDDYVIARLDANKAAREVKDATPSSSRRTGSQSDGFETALAKAEKSGGTELPTDFEMRKRIVNALADRQRSNKPAWHS